jgi:predicted CXXCH cytochrome family protein
MKRGYLIVLALAVVLAGSLLTTGCRSSTRHSWLTFFFDGVPAETATNSQAMTSGTNASPEKTAVAITQPATLKPAPNVVHPPFAQNKCGECHDRASISTDAKLPLLQLCFNCHKDFLTGQKVKHQPVENGECTSCHAPHQSPYKNLLLQKGNALCLTCHDDPLANFKFKHEAVESGDCLDCHAAHATNFKGLLKKSVKETCEDCHADLIKKKDIHQPVGGGDCLACHVAHASNKKNLVKKNTPALCWDCHDNFLEKAKFQHDVVEDCTSCHNPHQSAENFLLVKDVLKLCGDCHDDKDLKADKGHAGFEGKSCVVCHDPHIGTDKNLLKPAAKPK